MKSGGHIPWAAIAICEMSKTFWKREISVWTKIWGTIQRTNYTIWRIGWISPKLRKRQSTKSSIWKKILRRFFWLCFDRGEEYKRKKFWLLILKNWKMCVIRIIHPRRLNAKVVLITQKDEEINCISCSRWFSKIIRKRLRIPRTQSETGIHREERISAENLMTIGKSFTTWGNKKMTKESIRFFGIMQKLGKTYILGDFIYRHHNQSRVHLYVPRKESYLLPLNFSFHQVNFCRSGGCTRTNLWLFWMSTRTEICQIRWRVSQDLRYWTKLFWKGCNQSGKWYTKIQTTSRPDHIWRDALTRIWKAAQRKKSRLFHVKDRIPEHAHGKPLFQNDKSQSVWSKIQLCWLCRRRTEFCCVLQLCARIHFVFFYRRK